MLKQQAAKAFEIIDLGPRLETQPAYADRIVVQKLPRELGVAPVLQIAMAIMDAAKTEFRIKDEEIWVHGLHPDEKDGWRIEIRSDDPIAHYKFQPVVAQIIADRLSAIDEAQKAEPDQPQPEPPPALNM